MTPPLARVHNQFLLAWKHLLHGFQVQARLRRTRRLAIRRLRVQETAGVPAERFLRPMEYAAAFSNRAAALPRASAICSLRYASASLIIRFFSSNAPETSR